MMKDAAVKIENLSFSYNDESQNVLKNINIEINKNDFCVLLGKSGSGKSTLLRCINGLNTLSFGNVYINNTKLTKDNKNKIRTNIGMIFQEYNLVNRLTALENVLCGILSKIPNWRVALRYFTADEKEFGYSLLEKVGLSQFANTRVDRLSGGQKQRVGIARALAQHPSILLADEPISSLDPVSSEEILELLVDICHNENLTVIVSLHQIEYAKMYGERIIGLKDGDIMFDSSSDQLDSKAVDFIYSRGVANEQ